jgi:hypothetical protein
VEVYLIHDRVGDRHKIGVSTDPVRRLRQLQTGNATPLDLQGRFATPRARQLESQLHQRYAPHRLAGEWFDLPPGEAAAFRTRCGFYNDFLYRRDAALEADVPE